MKNEQMPEQTPEQPVMEAHEQVQPVAAEITKGAVHMSLPVWIIGGLATVVFAGMVMGLSLKKDTDDSQVGTEEATPTPSVSASATATATATATPTLTPSPSPTVTMVTDAGVTWLKEPKVVGDLKLTKASEGSDYVPEAKYYQVGTDNGKDIIFVVVSYEGPGRGLGAYLVKTSDAAYELIGNSSPSFQKEDGTIDKDSIQSTFSTAVTLNQTKVYNSVAYKKTIVYKSKTLKVGYGGMNDPFFVSQITAGDGFEYTNTKLADMADGTFYQVDETVVNGVQGRAYMLQRQNDTFSYYGLAPGFVSDDGVPSVTWSDGSVNKLTYRYDQVSRCGSATFNAVLSDVTLADLQKIGTTKDGESIYGFKTADHAVVKGRYAALTDGKYYDTTKNDYVSITLADYFKANAVFVYEDAFDNLVLFTSTYYGSGAECGKPVVYLYPTTDTNVSVQVGARVTKSEPEYGNGWMNVLAKPNGQLTVNGKQYGNLFWEGTGNGSYPTMNKVGVVVAQKDLVSTLRTQLTQLGLNTQESADFMEFWESRLPKTPFVRLSWMGTREMNELAPLSISPKPDTMIRIFLDFEGMQSSPSVMPVAQRLSSIPRKGFTVVEWGGLLIK